MIKDVEEYLGRLAVGEKFVPTSKRYFEDFQVGDKFTTPAKVITHTELDLFCMVTGHGGIHIDGELARALGFKDKVVPGLYTLSQINGLMHRIGLHEKTLLFLGLERVRFLHPVFPGDAIWMELEVKGKKDVAKWKEFGIITYGFVIRNQDGQPVCEGEASYQCRRRTPLP